MLEKPKNYEEARKIVENAVDDELTSKSMKKAKMLILLAVGVGTAASVAIGVMTDDATLGIIAFSNAIILALPSTIPYVRIKNVTNVVHDGSYFEKVDDEDLMRVATNYVRKYNEYEESKGRGK